MIEYLQPFLAKVIDLGIERLARPRIKIPNRKELIEKRLRQLQAIEEKLGRDLPEPVEPAAPSEDVSTGCIPCARAHLATVAGTLKEALRFARAEGMEHPEVQSRLQAAEEDVTAIERHDWTPEKIAKSPPGERELILETLPKLRTLRQQIIQIVTLEDLEKAAAAAAELSTEFRLGVLRLRGVNVDKLVSLAKKVEAGEMTIEEAKEAMVDAT